MPTAYWPQRFCCILRLSDDIVLLAGGIQQGSDQASGEQDAADARDQEDMADGAPSPGVRFYWIRLRTNLGRRKGTIHAVLTAASAHDECL